MPDETVSGDERILVGVVGAPHGVRGELRLKSYTEVPMTLAAFGALWSGDGRRLMIKTARPLKDDMLVARFEGIDGRDAAAALTNLPLFVARHALPPPDDDEFYHADLIGLSAETTAGVVCGKVAGLQNFGAGDLLEIAPPSGDTFLVPFTKVFVPVIDMQGRRLVLAEESLPAEQSGAHPAIEG